MAKWATGKRSQAISDRSGMAFPYTEMVKEWNGSFVHISEFEAKHPQIRVKHNRADAIALQNTRNMKFQQPSVKFSNDTTISDSGGASVGVANLSLPGDFAFKTQDFEITRKLYIIWKLYWKEISHDTETYVFTSSGMVTTGGV